MTLRTLPGQPPVEITLRRSARTRRFSLRVSQRDGRVTLSMPPRAAEAEALAFATEKAGWIRRVLAQAPAREIVAIGATLPLEGRMVTLTAAPVRAPRLEGDMLLIPGDPDRAAMRVRAFLKLLARQRLQAASEQYAARLGQQVRAITLRDTRSRWGSCTHDGRLMYSWRLIMAPPARISPAPR